MERLKQKLRSLRDASGSGELHDLCVEILGYLDGHEDGFNSVAARVQMPVFSEDELQKLNKKYQPLRG